MWLICLIPLVTSHVAKLAFRVLVPTTYTGFEPRRPTLLLSAQASYHFLNATVTPYLWASAATLLFPLSKTLLSQASSWFLSPFYSLLKCHLPHLS